MQLAEGSHIFPAQEKIKSSLVIRQVMAGGDSVFAHPLKCYYRYVPPQGDTLAPRQLSVTVSKRRFKHAVDRNRIKRLMRENYRLHKALFPRHDHYSLQMCWMYVGKDLPDFQTISDAVVAMAAKLSKSTGQ